MLHLLLTRGLAVVWAASLIESLGAPVPAFPLLLLAGSVAAEYRFSAVPLVIASAVGFWIGNIAWYAFGRIEGRRVLGLLCRLSLNPDACVGRAERRFRRRPAVTVAAAKFIPGFSLMVAPLAGILRMSPVNSRQSTAPHDRVVGGSRHVRSAVRQTCPSARDAYTASYWNARRRRRLGLCRLEAIREALARAALLRSLASRVRNCKDCSPLSQWMVLVIEPGERAFTGSAQMVPGARRIPPGEFEKHIDTMPVDEGIILYCT